jgi:hypothetical protein
MTGEFMRQVFESLGDADPADERVPVLTPAESAAWVALVVHLTRPGHQPPVPVSFRPRQA